MPFFVPHRPRETCLKSQVAIWRMFRHPKVSTTQALKTHRWNAWGRRDYKPTWWYYSLVFTDALNAKKLSIDTHFNGMISLWIHKIVIQKSKYLPLIPSWRGWNTRSINTFMECQTASIQPARRRHCVVTCVPRLIQNMTDFYQTFHNFFPSLHENLK